jgi:phenylalanyl-tRNA synthetase beta chain
MKLGVQWLREWVDVGDDVNALSHSLTMAGLEIEGNYPAAAPLPGVVVAEVISVARHPDAEKLNICQVSTGSEVVQIVCGAPNVRAGMKAPLAQIGATLPGGAAGGIEIKKAKLRGVESFGMLCSARELALSEDASGLLDLPQEMVVGTDLVKALSLDDRVLEINMTPNRGDCMSVAGVAREAAAVCGKVVHAPQMNPVASQSDAKFSVKIEAGNACPKFVGRVIKGVRANQPSPLWMRERLRRAGIRSINLLVDVTNYIVLELGQPMHAYDLTKLTSGIVVRTARANESLTLLDGRTIELANDILIIADSQTVLGMAGVMGGEASGISDATTDIFLEAAHFTPDAIAGRGRRFGLITDASQRFERGVDPVLPELAMERATRLILDNAGGVPGATIITLGDALPAAPTIRLRHERVNRVLGINIAAEKITAYLTTLGMSPKVGNGEWRVMSPSWRFDIKIEEDLIEEVARLHGYDNIPPADATMSQKLCSWTETAVPSERAADVLIDRGYQEAITYSFVDPQWQGLMFPGETAAILVNPLSVELSAMRLSLWPGLAQAVRENLRRQQSRVRLFEVGRKFVGSAEIDVIAGLAVGSAEPEQWAASYRKVDFFDVKADVEAILALSGDAKAFTFNAATLSALHPGQTARIYRGSESVGWLGAIHPEVAKKMDLTYPLFVFELEVQAALAACVPQLADISRFPAIRRDLAVIVDEAVQFDQLADAVRTSAGQLLNDLSVLSVYRGEQLDKGKKSIALGLNLQDTSRTLTDQDADRVVAQVIEHLRTGFGGIIRDK